MTQLMLGSKKARIIKLFNTTLTLSFMAFGILGSWWLLTWAVNGKLNSIKPLSETQITAELRERQLTCLARNIYYEAGSEPFEGKVAVAQVTINRTNSGKFPADICKVIYQKNIFYEKVVCQFSWYCDKAASLKPIHNSAYNESMTVAKKVLLEGFRLPGLHDALYYHADYVNPNWGKERITKIGQHIFYK